MYIQDLLLQDGATVVKQTEECCWNLTYIVEEQSYFIRTKPWFTLCAGAFSFSQINHVHVF